MGTIANSRAALQGSVERAVTDEHPPHTLSSPPAVFPLACLSPLQIPSRFSLHFLILFLPLLPLLSSPLLLFHLLFINSSLSRSSFHSPTFSPFAFLIIIPLPPLLFIFLLLLVPDITMFFTFSPFRPYKSSSSSSTLPSLSSPLLSSPLFPISLICLHPASFPLGSAQPVVPLRLLGPVCKRWSRQWQPENSR